MTPPTADDWSQAEIVRSLQRIETKVDALAAGYVPRTEWEIWAETRDREIRELKAARAPWWTWATLALSGLAMLITLIQNIP